MHKTAEIIEFQSNKSLEIEIEIKAKKLALAVANFSFSVDRQISNLKLNLRAAISANAVLRESVDYFNSMIDEKDFDSEEFYSVAKNLRDLVDFEKEAANGIK